jgi:hypothetical protein
MLKQEATLLLACKIMEMSDLRFKGIQRWIDRCRAQPELRIIAARLDIVTKSDNSTSKEALSKKVTKIDLHQLYAVKLVINSLAFDTKATTGICG